MSEVTEESVAEKAQILEDKRARIRELGLAKTGNLHQVHLETVAEQQAAEEARLDAELEAAEHAAGIENIRESRPLLSHQKDELAAQVAEQEEKRSTRRSRASSADKKGDE